MDNFDYMWLGKELDYDVDIYEKGVYEELEIQENQQLLMLKLSQLRGEIPTSLQDDDISVDTNTKGY